MEFTIDITSCKRIPVKLEIMFEPGGVLLTDGHLVFYSLSVFDWRGAKSLNKLTIKVLVVRKATFFNDALNSFVAVFQQPASMPETDHV